jgi:plasmid maintenance system antidote protein VapI
MPKTKIIEIDSDKLRRAIVKRNLHVTKISVEMGRSPVFVTNIIQRGRMTPSVAILLEKMYDIQPHEYELVKPEPDPETVEVVPANEAGEQNTPAIDYVQLYNVVYAAMLAALKKNASDMREHLFTGKEVS